jgi:hypothetical protein
MGVNVYSYAGIGVKIINPYVVTMKKNCDHSVPANAIFCPTCGKEAYISEKDLHIALKDIPDYFSHVTSTDNEDHFVFMINAMVNERGGCNSSHGGISEITLHQKKNNLREYLEPFSLWDEEFYGLWCVQYVSY